MMRYENIIRDTIKDIGMEAYQYLGYNYTVYCVNYILENMMNGKSHSGQFGEMYAECAEFYCKDLKPTSIERSVRFFRCKLIGLVDEDTRKGLSIDGMVTNSSFLYGLVAIVTAKLDALSESVKNIPERVEKDKELYFLLTNGNGFVNAYDIAKTAKILNRTNIDENNEEELVEFAKTLPGVKYVYSSKDLTPEDFLRYGQKVLAIRFCTREFDYTIREAKEMVEDLIKEKRYNG